MNELIAQHKNLIESEAAKHAKWLPVSYVESEAYHIANEAAKTYDPKSGNKFSTHLHNQLKQLSRLSTEHGNIVRMPEHSQYNLNKIHRYMENYRGEHGRDPSVEEISHHTTLPFKKVNALLRGKKTNVTLSTSTHEPSFVDEQGVLDDWIHMVYHDLPKQDKYIFESFTGFGGKTVLDEAQIAKHLGIDVALVKRRLKIIGDEIAKGTQ